jgi:hypothetical protein
MEILIAVFLVLFAIAYYGSAMLAAGKYEHAIAAYHTVAALLLFLLVVAVIAA